LPGQASGLLRLMYRYRDFRYVVPFVVQLGLYVSPVGFSSGIVPEQWRVALRLESDGGGDRRFQMVAAAWRNRTVLAGNSAFHPVIVVAAVFRFVVFPENRASTGGCDIV